MAIRQAKDSDRDAIWAILEPMIRAGETYTLPREMSKEDALAYWFSAEKETFVWEENGTILGTYFLKANQQGWRSACGELRVCDGGCGAGTGNCEGDVFAFAHAGEGARVSRDAV